MDQFQQRPTFILPQSTDNTFQLGRNTVINSPLDLQNRYGSVKNNIYSDPTPFNIISPAPVILPENRLTMLHNPYIQRLSVNPQFNDPINLNNLVRKTMPPTEYQLKAKGKYTKDIKIAKNLVRKPKENSNVSLTGYDETQWKCLDHLEMREMILLDPIDVYPKYERICVQCLSKLNAKYKGQFRCELYSEVIMQNKHKIDQIRTHNVNLNTTGGSKYVDSVYDFTFDFIEPIADEILDLVSYFGDEVLEKISGDQDQFKIQELKDFIKTMDFNSRGDPNLNNIGDNKALKSKYVALAVFLLKFNENGINSNTIPQGISEKLKAYLLEIISLRHYIVRKFTDWLKFLTGDIYNYIFSVDRREVDNNFRNNLQIEYGNVVVQNNDDEIFKLKNFYDLELRKKDEKIISLLNELDRVKKENDFLRNNHNLVGEHEQMINNLKNQIKNLENDLRNIKNNNLQLAQSNESLARDNRDHLNHVEELNRRIQVLKNELEKDFNTRLETLRNENNDLLNQNKNLTNLRDEAKNNINRLGNEIDKYQHEIMRLDQLVKNNDNSRDLLVKNSQLLKENDDLRKQLLHLHENDDENQKFRNMLLRARDDYSNLADHYEKLLDEAKNQVKANDLLKEMVKDLQSRVHGNNTYVPYGTDKYLNPNDPLHKNKPVDLNHVNDTLKKVEGDSNNLKKRLSTFDNPNANKSHNTPGAYNNLVQNYPNVLPKNNTQGKPIINIDTI